jgi:hypothetical protein
MSDEKKDPKTEASDTAVDHEERAAKDELFEAIDHFKNAASILFQRARKDPAVQGAKEEAGKIAKKIGDTAEPVAKQLTSDLKRLTKDVMDVVEGRRGLTPKKKKKKKSDEEQE